MDQLIRISGEFSLTESINICVIISSSSNQNSYIERCLSICLKFIRSFIGEGKFELVWRSIEKAGKVWFVVRAHDTIPFSFVSSLSQLINQLGIKLRADNDFYSQVQHVSQ